MADILKFEDHAKNDLDKHMDKFYAAAEDFDKSGSRKDAERLFEVMQEGLREALKNIDLEEASRITKEMKQERWEKYKNTLKFMPQDITGKIAFLANMMIGFIPNIFSEDTDGSSDAYYIFSDSLYDELEPAMNVLKIECKKNRAIIPSYDFITVEGYDELKAATEECLGSIIELCMEREGKEEDILEKLYRLSNLNIFLNRKIFCSDAEMEEKRRGR